MHSHVSIRKPYIRGFQRISILKKLPFKPKQDQPRAKRNEMLIGLRPLIEAVESGKEIDKVLMQQGLKGELINEARDVLRRYAIPYKTVPLEKLNSISRKNHQGIIAFVSPLSFGNIENIVAEIYERGETPNLILLDGVTDVRNFGAICRSAECMGVQAVIIPENGSAQVNEEAIKTSAGALYNLPLCRVKSLSRTIEFLQQSGISVTCCSEKARKPLDQVNLTTPSCIVMGNEETGISSEIMRKTDNLALIPMKGKTASLNVSVAAGIILYEIMRQRSADSAS